MAVLKRGDRVKITGILPNDPAPLPIGLEGTVSNVMNQSTSIEQIQVDWDLWEGEDRPRSLMLLPTDPFEVVPPKRATRRRTPAKES
ncbi:hypothetical protein PBI_DEWDROP_115 [Microbacterium phage Dewdrop]|nr:hypothetical protein PBI_LEAF_115 [Microbacterium phage Leaf]QGZ17483.1 hypothetical protein PBI_DEWDROP_115 [Microbacterium phage Dewdrop]